MYSGDSLPIFVLASICCRRCCIHLFYDNKSNSVSWFLVGISYLRTLQRSLRRWAPLYLSGRPAFAEIDAVYIHLSCVSKNWRTAVVVNGIYYAIVQNHGF